MFKRRAASVDQMEVLTSRHSVVCALLAVLAAVGLAGCAWKGDGGEVAAALLASSQVETRSFSGSLKFESTGGEAAGGSLNTNMTFDGAIDTSDENAPKMVMNMTADGSTTSIVVPGDGKLYLTFEGKSYSTEIPAGTAKASTVDPAKIYATLGSAVGGFKVSQPLTNHAGESVHTVTAEVSKSKLCGPVLDAFGEALSKTSGIGGQLGAGGKDETKMLKGFCESMLKSDPRVWFGIDDGKLTDVELAAELQVPFAGTMRVELIYHEFNQGAEQTGFEAPAGATPLGSLDQLAAGSASGSGAALGPGTLH